MKDFLLIVFRSRTQTLAFADRLKAGAIPYEVTEAPARLAVGCGLALRVPAEMNDRVRLLLTPVPVGFSGLYFVKNGRPAAFD